MENSDRRARDVAPPAPGGGASSDRSQSRRSAARLRSRAGCAVPAPCAACQCPISRSCRPGKITRTVYNPLGKSHRREALLEQSQKIAASLDQIQIEGHEAHSARRVEINDQPVAGL